MNLKPFLLAAMAILFVTLFTGCATTQTNWNSRIGTYTYDQAVIDLGPPDKQAKLDDGRTVAEWISRYNNGGNTAIVSGLYGSPGGLGFIQTTGPQYYESKLQLIFTPNNILTAWSKK